MSRRLVLVALAGCGRLAFDPRADGGSGSTTDAASDGNAAQADALICPPTYTQTGGGCYRAVLSGSGLPWLAAEMDCEDDGPGTHLVVFASTAEMQVVDTLVPSNVTDHWIGATDIVTENTFVTVTNAPMTYVNWFTGQPDGTTGENCVRFNDDETLYDGDCTLSEDYVCEVDGIAPVPAAYGQ